MPSPIGEAYTKPMRYLLLIAILFCLQSCKQQPAATDYKLSDDYLSVRSRMITINMSDETLSERQSSTFALLNTFIKTYPLSENSLVLLASAKNLLAWQYDSLYNHLNPALKKNPFWTSVDLTKSQISSAETGKLFPAINLVDTLNASVNTSSLRGKLLFLDFWSSWCVSCRKQFPYLKQIYSKYHAKGLDIIGVSMDAKKAAWVGALKQDSVPWPQYCEFVNFQQNSLAKRFHLLGIPSNFLIDKNGILIGQDLSPEELEAIVSRL
jgi:thiol-disulfide isomerase/thioredoxin